MMKPVYQTMFGDRKGNCFQACLASIFDLSLEDVPHFYKDYDGTNDATLLLIREVTAWLDIQGFSLKLYWDDKLSEDELIKQISSMTNNYWVAVCEVKNYPESGHRVVYLGETLIHDPNPNKVELIRVKTAFIFHKN